MNKSLAGNVLRLIYCRAEKYPLKEAREVNLNEDKSVQTMGLSEVVIKRSTRNTKSQYPQKQERRGPMNRVFSSIFNMLGCGDEENIA